MAMAMDTEELVENEFRQWYETHQGPGDVILFLQEHHRLRDGAIRMDLSFTDDSTFTIVCPAEYPHGKNLLFDVRTEDQRLKKDWLQKVRDFATANRGQIKLPAILSKCMEYHRGNGNEAMTSLGVPSPQQDSDFEEEPGIIGPESTPPTSDDEMMADLVYNDENFTTHWDIEMDFLKKRWLQKEKELRGQLTGKPEPAASVEEPIESGILAVVAPPVVPSISAVPKMVPNLANDADPISPSRKKTKLDKGPVPKAGQQIFEHESAAFQILSNEMIALLKVAKNERIGGGQAQFDCEAIEDSLYHWRVRVNKFPEDHPLHKELAMLKTKFGYDTIELHLDFVPEYPFYPPSLRLVRPRLKGSLVQSLANIDILKLTFWNPARSVHDVLKQIKEILVSHARLDVDNERNDGTRYPEGAYLPLEDHLIKLALATEVRPRANFDIIEVDNLVKAPQLKTKEIPKDKSTKPKAGWKAGTGYGSGARSSEWDPESYVKAQQEKDKQILDILRSFIKDVEAIVACNDQKGSEAYAVIEGSCLLPFLEQELAQGSFIEIGRHLELYQLILDAIDMISKTPFLLPLLCNIPRQKFCIMALLKGLNDSAVQCLHHLKGKRGIAGGSAKSKVQKVQADDESVQHEKSKEDREVVNAEKIVDMFSSLQAKLASAGLTYSTQEQAVEESSVSIEMKPAGEENSAHRYVSQLKPLQFENKSITVTGASAHKFAKDHLEDKLTSETRLIWKEWTALRSSLPINLESSVFVRVDESHMNLMQALITGPEGTPYANGCFVFDICFPVSYPQKPPLVNLRTTGGGRVRFNPNLYNCGKVCLSLLGTWGGESGESWNGKTSTILQVLVSIQSLILVEEPYFNEPGYERTMGTEDGKKASEKYNKDCRANCVRHAMLEQLQQPPAGFEDVVRLHYTIKKDSIAKQLDDWIKLDSDNGGLKSDVTKLKNLMNSLLK